MSYRVEFNKKSIKALLKLPKSIQSNITKRIENLATDPYAGHNDVKKLSGELQAYRLRVGDYRVLYRILHDKVIIEIIHIAHRREVYR